MRPPPDSMAATRVVPMVDELAKTREGTTITLHLALLDAAETEIGLRGFLRTTLDDVADRAKVPLDVLHAHFTDMGSLLRALNERFVDQMKGAVDATTATGSWTGSRVREVIEIAVRSILDVVQDRQGLVRAFLAHSYEDPALAAGLREIGTHLTARLIAAVRECTDAPVPRERAVEFSLLLGVALAHHAILVGDGWSGTPFTREELADEMTRVISAYLADSSVS